MARLDINLAGRPFGNARPLALVTGVVAVGLALASMLNVYGALAAYRDLRLRSADLLATKAATVEAREEAKRLNGRVTDREKRRIRVSASSTAAIIGKRQLSWTRLFEQLERIQPRDVRILSILPNPQGRDMALIMECVARDNEPKLAFYNKLNQAPFRDAYIIAETLEADRRRFSLRCLYDPAGPDAEPICEPMPWETPCAERAKATVAVLATGVLPAGRGAR